MIVGFIQATLAGKRLRASEVFSLSVRWYDVGNRWNENFALNNERKMREIL